MAPKRKGATASAPHEAKKRRLTQTRAEDTQYLPSTAVEVPRNSLLQLPTELRLRIYAFLFPDKEVPAIRPRVNSHDAFRKLLREDGEACHTAIISTCRLVQQEACDVLYGSVPYEIVIDGELVRACMFNDGQTVGETINDRSTYYYYSSKREKTRRRTGHRFDDYRDALFTYIRSAKLLIKIYPRNDWRSVSSIAGRKEVRDDAYSRIFAAYDTRKTIMIVARQLEDAPMLDKLKVCADYPRETYRGAVGGESDLKWNLSALKSGRFKNVCFGELAPSASHPWSWPRRSEEEQEQEQRSRENQLASYKEDLAATMISNEPAEEVPTEYESLPHLKTFVRQFRGQLFFHTMCKELFEAVGFEAGDRRDMFEKRAKSILQIWKTEQDRFSQLVQTTKSSTEAIEKQSSLYAAGKPSAPSRRSVEYWDSSSDDADYGPGSSRRTAQKKHKSVFTDESPSSSPEPLAAATAQTTRSGRISRPRAS